MAHCLLWKHYKSIGDRISELKMLKALNIMIIGKPLANKIKINSRMYMNIRKQWYDRMLIKLTYNGQSRTIKEWAEILNIPYKSFRDRIYHYTQYDKIFTKPYISKDTISKIQVLFNGELTTFGKLSETYHLSPGIIKKRYEKHGDISKCLDPIKPIPKVEYKGKMYNLRELSELAGITYKQFRNQYYGTKKSIEDIMSRKEYTPLNGKRIPIDGKTYNGVEISKMFNICRTKISEALKTHTVEEIGIMIKSGKLDNKKPITYQIDGEYLTQKQISEKYGISYSSLRVYIHKYDITTAIEKLLALKRQRG